MAAKVLHISSFTGGVVGPTITMLGPVEDGGTIIAQTAPGCWGPMITPHFKGGHEITQPVAVEGARIGDAIVIKIRHLKLRSKATSSGTSEEIEGRTIGSGPLTITKCPECGTVSPATRLEGIGPQAIRCAACGAEAIPHEMTCGYTMVFDQNSKFGVTVGKEGAADIARAARAYAGLPEASQQNPVLVLANADLPGILARVRPFIGNIGTVPAMELSDSSNAGDAARFLYRAPVVAAERDQTLGLLTDAHMDIDSVREGAILICPVKVDGGGVYIGDVHAMQGDGEIAGHTTDVSAEATIEVKVVKGLGLEGPLLLPLAEDLPFLSKPFTKAETTAGRQLAQEWGVTLEEVAPVQVIGSAQNLNDATSRALDRAAKLFCMSLGEVRNRATITGALEIGRRPGVVTVTLLVPVERLSSLGILDLVHEQYGPGEA